MALKIMRIVGACMILVGLLINHHVGRDLAEMDEYLANLDRSPNVGEQIERDSIENGLTFGWAFLAPGLILAVGLPLMDRYQKSKRST